MEKVDITIFGAGVIGLAIASRLSNYQKDIFVVEKEQSFGKGISSRNSEVIHAGIYYPSQSLKAKTCIEGNQLLYETCTRNNIPFKKIGKLIIATNNQEAEQIDELYRNGKANGVKGLEIIDSAGVEKLEPNIKGVCALFSPGTGIIDTHKLMEHLYKKAKDNRIGFIFQSEVKDIKKSDGFYEIETEDKQKEISRFASRIVINAAGLYSDLIASMAGMDIKKLNYDLKFCKGDYFRLSADKSKLIQRLVYPVPKQSNGGLGIHLTPDISGQVKIGPDAQYLKENIEDYDVDENKKSEFYNSVNKFAPFIQSEDIYPDMAGIRPKLEKPNGSFRDFIIREESGNGFRGFVNLIGIESPGLTAALSIAKYVEGLLKVYLN